MKPKDIEVGRKYVNSQHPGVIYLGIGKRLVDSVSGIETKRISKFLMIKAGGGDFNNFIVHHSKTNKCLWDAFRPLEA